MKLLNGKETYGTKVQRGKNGAKHIVDEMAAGKMRLIKTCFGGEDRLLNMFHISVMR